MEVGLRALTWGMMIGMDEKRTVTFAMGAESGVVYAPGAFDRSKGKSVPLRIEGSDEVHEATIKDVTVEGGKVIVEAELTEVSLIDGHFELGFREAKP